MKHPEQPPAALNLSISFESSKFVRDGTALLVSYGEWIHQEVAPCAGWKGKFDYHCASVSPHSAVRQFAVPAAQGAAANEGTAASLERPTSWWHSFSGKGSERQLRSIDPLLELQWDPFSANRSLKEMLNAVDQKIDAPFFRTSTAAVPSRMRMAQDLIEDSDAYRLRIDMPGLSKEELKVTVEDGQLVIKGEHKAEKSDDGWSSHNYDSYNTRLTLPKHVKVEDVKAELKYGVLRVVMPKYKEDPKKSAIPIEVH